MFLVPIENNEIVINQLEEAGLEENIGFLNLDFDLYDDYLREFLRPAVNHVVIFGDCAFSHVSICDKDKHSLADMIKEKHGEEKCKSLVMHGMGTRSFYHIFRALLRRNEKPRKVLFEVTPMMLAPKAYLMPRTQHPALIGKILSATKEPGADLIEYASLTQERFNKLRSESAVSFQESKNDDIIKLYMKMNYMHTIKEDNERIVYLKKLIEELNTIGIPVSLYIPPVNYKYGEKLLGGDFTVYYKEMFSSLWGFLDGLNYDALDASFLLDEIDFSLENNHDETANYAGRLKLLNFLEAFIEEA